MRQWISVADFCEKYKVGDATVYKFIKKMPKDSVIIKYSQTRLDENFFIRRREFYKRVKLETQEMYYFFSEYFNDNQIASAISAITDKKYSTHSIYFFINAGLFRHDADYIFLYEVSGQMWSVWRALRWLTMRTFNASRRYNTGVRKYGLIKAIEQINDKRMELAA